MFHIFLLFVSKNKAIVFSFYRDFLKLFYYNVSKLGSFQINFTLRLFFSMNVPDLSNILNLFHVEKYMIHLTNKSKNFLSDLILMNMSITRFLVFFPRKKRIIFSNAATNTFRNNIFCNSYNYYWLTRNWKLTAEFAHYRISTNKGSYKSKKNKHICEVVRIFLPLYFNSEIYLILSSKA